MTINSDPGKNSSEPALAVGGAGAAVGALLTLLMAFGVDLSEDQVKAILGFVLIGGPLIYAAIIRVKVFAPATVAAMLRRNRSTPK